MMNNAAFHLSGSATPRQQPLMMLPSHSPPNPPRLMSSSEAASFSMALAANNANMAAAAGLANSGLNFGGHHRDLLHFGGLNPAFSYLNSFNGLPMMQMGFGLFPQHNFMSKSPGMVSPVTSGFFGNFANNKDDDASCQKQSPNSFPDSPRSGSRGSPMESHLKRTKLPKGKSPPEQTTCPLCKQTVSGQNLNEHFMEELKTYRQEPVNTRIVSSSSPSPPEHVNQSTHSGQTPGENDARLEVYLRVRGNRKTRCPSQTSASHFLGDHPSHSRRSSASSSTGSTRSLRVAPHPYASNSKRSKHERIEAIQVEDAEVIVDVEEEEDDEEHHREEAPLRIDNSPTGHPYGSSNRSPLHNLWNQSDLPRKKRPIDTAEDLTEKNSKSINPRHSPPSTSPMSDSAST